MKLMFLLIACVMSVSSFAGPRCLKDRNPCDPDLLCTFKAQWYSKVFLYVATTMNDQARKGKKPKDGYYYDGALYDASMAQATQENSGSTASQINEAAGQIFEKKLEKFALSSFEMPRCELNGRYDTTRSPPEGYQGMSTDSDCKVTVKYYGHHYDPATFGQNGTTCEEFYEADYAHEQIHVKACQAAKKGHVKDHFSINVLVKEEATAYKHSMQLAEARYRYLLSQCSDKYPNQENARTQYKKMNDLLKGYESRGAK